MVSLSAVHTRASLNSVRMVCLHESNHHWIKVMTQPTTLLRCQAPCLSHTLSHAQTIHLVQPESTATSRYCWEIDVPQSLACKTLLEEKGTTTSKLKSFQSAQRFGMFDGAKECIGCGRGVLRVSAQQNQCAWYARAMPLTVSWHVLGAHTWAPGCRNVIHC